uniref:Uncharacterized protein n=1 Tax=Trichobilharzia regenti TaxID=157069 RepID=A0AA85JYA2_TRIRE|nr:unnamed protein product [Trichobilharzia regenti]
MNNNLNPSAPSGPRNYHNISSRTVNTNNIPVCCQEGTSQMKSFLPGNKLPHPSGMQRSSLRTSTVGQSKNVLWSPDSLSSNSRGSSHDNSSLPCLSYVSRCSSNPTVRNYDSKSHSRPSQLTSEPSTSHTKPLGCHAAQIRRFQESITFALIDNRLSMPPFSRVRNMHISTRSRNRTSNLSVLHSKKAVLSVVYAIVKFRIKQYLIDLRKHINRSLDTLFSHMFENYDITSRNTLAADILGLSPLLCSRECKHCPKIMPDNECHTFQKCESSCFNLHSNHVIDQMSSTSCDSLPPKQTSIPDSTVVQGSCAINSECIGGMCACLWAPAYRLMKLMFI